MLKYW